jgi:hypothetical protein
LDLNAVPSQTFAQELDTVRDQTQDLELWVGGWDMLPQKDHAANSVQQLQGQYNSTSGAKVPGAVDGTLCQEMDMLKKKLSAMEGQIGDKGFFNLKSWIVVKKISSCPVSTGISSASLCW